MATLCGVGNAIEMTVRPSRLTVEDQPNWVSTQLELKENGMVLVSASLALTTDDLAELRVRLLDLVAGRLPAFTLQATDGDIVFEGHKADRPGHILLGFWQGLPYELQRGYKFAVNAEDIPPFVRSLASEEITALPSGRVPQ